MSIKLFKAGDVLGKYALSESEAEALNSKLLRNEAIKSAWLARPVATLATLPFVGKTYRSRGRRSVNKVSAWAVKLPKHASEAAALGARYGFEFADLFGHPENAKLCGSGFLLEAVILGMSEALAKATPTDRERHIACIRGFAGILEAGASTWLSGINGDLCNAELHNTRLGHLADIQHQMRVNHAWHRSGKNAAFSKGLIAGVTV